jgi:phenylacetate-coenzyme A ligase PaaK-like adenylate-forming protein
VRAVPQGILLQVTAGNVFLGFLDALVSALLTKNVSIVKVSSGNQTFPALLARALAEADPGGKVKGAVAIVHWPGGLEEVEAAFARSVDAVVVWGGEAAVATYKRLLPPGVPLLEHGPKISFQVVCREALAAKPLEEVAGAIAHEVMLWDQAACTSPQNLFVEEGIDVSALMGAIGAALDRCELPRGRLDDDEEVTLLLERQRAQVSRLVSGGAALAGRDYLLHFERARGLRPSPLHRTLLLKSFRDLDDLDDQIAPFARNLQSCSYLATGSAREPLLARLASRGVTRFAPLGRVLEGAAGAPHDGRWPLAELVRWVADEHPRFDVLALAREAAATVPFYEKLYAGATLGSPADLRPIAAGDLAEEALPGSRALLRAGTYGGAIFSSGGTTGKPKFAFFTHEELAAVGRMLGKGLRLQGVRPGDLCANLFVAGNLWSSFLAVEHAIAAVGAVSLPIGGAADPAQTLQYLSDFAPRVVLGLPSLLVSLAGHAKAAREAPPRVPIVCYAGEHLNRQARALLGEVFRTERCFSAGYASVDAGPIGYQCPSCGDREHHLFEDQVHLAIVEGEAVVTSRVRTVMPIVHLRTGDHVEWSSEEGAACACGSRDRRFILHGRCDGQINLWASRIGVEEIEAGLAAAGIQAPLFQVTVDEDSLTIVIEGRSEVSGAAQAVYERCKDLRATHPFSFVEPRLAVRAVEAGSLPRVARTGKIRTVVDRRRL